MCSKIKLVYVAGPLSPGNYRSVHPAIDYLYNKSALERLAVEVLLSSYIPYCPALDSQYFIHLKPGEYITEAMIKRMSKDFLERCDAVLLANNWHKSRGTLEEIKLANKLEIPVFTSLKKLKRQQKTIINADAYLEALK